MSVCRVLRTNSRTFVVEEDLCRLTYMHRKFWQLGRPNLSRSCQMWFEIRRALLGVEC
jgi:hypothetical protein